MEKTTRFSGADWGSEQKDIMIVGQGGIGSWLSLNLARIGHTLYLVDDDHVDETNVTGGQMFTKGQIGLDKVAAVRDVCRIFGCDNMIETLFTKFNRNIGITKIVMTGLDNMKARREVFEAWKDTVNIMDEKQRNEFLLVDGRLTIEMWEVFAIRGDDNEAIKKYEEEHLFADEEAVLLDCSTKQSTFAAMSIAGSMTSVLCNFLTNAKMNVDFRSVPFYQRMYFPMAMHTAIHEIVEETDNKAEIIEESPKIEIINGK